ncbi:hypothetical protein R5O87_18225 [Arthrobacter globiformis]|uniref:hypothetical protein n=1 Tax=Arthrobacter globiformis TaxID=1665 RepID=UPI0039797F7C
MFSGSPAIAGLFAVGLFGRFEATVIFREEVLNPERTIPRATYGVVIPSQSCTPLTAFALINAYGADVVMDVLTNNVADASGTSVRDYAGEVAYYAAVLLLFTSAFALSLSAHNILARISGRNPPAQTGHKPRTAHLTASLVVSIASLGVLLILLLAQVAKTGLYGYIAGIYSYGMLIMMTLVSPWFMAAG